MNAIFKYFEAKFFWIVVASIRIFLLASKGHKLEKTKASTLKRPTLTASYVNMSLNKQLSRRFDQLALMNVYLSDKLQVNTLLTAWLMTLIFFIQPGCSNVDLTPRLEQPSFKKSDLICIKPPPPGLRNNKILFIVDKSGSNSQGTDRNNVRRAKNIQRFLDDNYDREFTEWGFIAFGIRTDDVEAYVNDGNKYQATFGSSETMQKAIDELRDVPDTGCTPYLKALQMAKIGIKKDIEDNTKEDNVYNVFFMSDGVPTDNSQGCISKKSTIENSPSDPYLQMVKEIVTLKSGRIFFHSVYYTDPVTSQPDPFAARGLEYMSQVGGGTFTNLEQSETMEFQEVRVGEIPENVILKRMHVINLTSSFCIDGSVDADSDVDGICDKDELVFNSTYKSKLDQLSGSPRFDPLNRNSINPAYADKFSYSQTVLLTGLGMPQCDNPEPDKDYDLLNSCEENLLFDRQPNGPTPQWTDNLKRIASGSALASNPDSDGDGFLDSIEYFTFGVLSSALNNKSLENSYAGGVSGEVILEQHRHPSNPTLVGKDTVDFRVTFVRFNELGESCHRVEIKQLPLYSTKKVLLENMSNIENLVHEDDENIILIYYIATPEDDPNGPGYLFYKYHKLKFNKHHLQKLEINDFDHYDIPSMSI